MTTTPRRHTILLTVSGGGFFWQSRSVALSLAEQFEIHYISPEPEHAFAGRGLPAAPWHAVTRITTLGDRTFWQKGRNTVVGLRDAWRVLRRVRPEAVVCVATSLAVPLCMWARLLGIRTVFVESITRVTTPSATGRILSRLGLCDRLYVQWPEGERLYPNAIYRGTVL